MDKKYDIQLNWDINSSYCNPTVASIETPIGFFSIKPKHIFGDFYKELCQISSTILTIDKGDHDNGYLAMQYVESVLKQKAKAIDFIFKNKRPMLKVGRKADTHDLLNKFTKTELRKLDFDFNEFDKNPVIYLLIVGCKYHTENEKYKKQFVPDMSIYDSIRDEQNKKYIKIVLGNRTFKFTAVIGNFIKSYKWMLFYDTEIEDFIEVTKIK